MKYTTLISVNQLRDLLSSGTPCMVFDTSFELAKPQLGWEQFLQTHIEGAIYANLDTDLSAKEPGAQTASGGRHPLPSRANFAQWLGSQGFSNGMQAVVYDRNGSSQAGRLWWMLQWLGHGAAAVLDGGLSAWQALGGACTGGEPTPRPATVFAPQEPLTRLVNVSTVQQQLGRNQTIVDARPAARYRGEVEPLDRVAGHIPGALNRPFSDNFTLDGKFKDPAQLRAEFDALLAGRDPAAVVHHCGSGVTAIPNILAVERAGLGRSALFAGSWSEWSSDASRPVATG